MFDSIFFVFYIFNFIYSYFGLALILDSIKFLSWWCWSFSIYYNSIFFTTFMSEPALVIFVRTSVFVEISTLLDTFWMQHFDMHVKFFYHSKNVITTISLVLMNIIWFLCFMTKTALFKITLSCLKAMIFDTSGEVVSLNNQI